MGSAGINVGKCRKACIIPPLGQPAQTSECSGPGRSIEYIKTGCGLVLRLPDTQEALDPRGGPAECKVIYRNHFWRSKPSLAGEGEVRGGCYCQFTNISMGRSIGQASSGALGNSSIVPAIRTDGNLHLHVGIWLALTPLFHSDSSVHFLLLTSVWSATTTHSIRKLSLLSLFAWSIQSRRLIEKELWCLKEGWTQLCGVLKPLKCYKRYKQYIGFISSENMRHFLGV